MKSDLGAGEGVDPASTDNGLLDGIRVQDEQAWTQFVEVYSPLIYVWCRRFDLQSSDARDVSQQVLLAVSRSIGTFSKKEESGSFRVGFSPSLETSSEII